MKTIMFKDVTSKIMNGQSEGPEQLNTAEEGSSAESYLPSDEMEQASFSEIGSFEAGRILRKAKIKGDPTLLRGKPERLITKRDLEKSDLKPRFKIGLQDVEYNVSRAFEFVDDEREEEPTKYDAVICYVKTPGGEIVTRSYYRSNSQGVWRYLPDYAMMYGGGPWCGKGAGEQQLTLPMEIQGALNDIVVKSKKINRFKREDDKVSEKECFFGMAKRIQDFPIPETGEYTKSRKDGEIKDDLGMEVNCQPWQSLGEQDDVAPENMTIPQLLAPDFSRQVGEFQMESEIYGKATVRSYRSNNGGLVWSVLEDENGRAFITGAQMEAKITSTGLRERWVDVGHFAMPLYEYSEQSLGMGDREDRKKPYVGMWKNYLSKIPIIQEYLETRSAR